MIARLSGLQICEQPPLGVGNDRRGQSRGGAGRGDGVMEVLRERKNRNQALRISAVGWDGEGSIIRLLQDQNTQRGREDSLVHSKHFRQLPKNKEAN